MPESEISTGRRRQVDRVLELYRQHPQTTGRVRKADRLLANDLCRQGIAVDSVETAFLLVAARLAQSSQQPPTTIRSLHYFLPTIREVLDCALDYGYLSYLRRLNYNADTDSDHHFP